MTPIDRFHLQMKQSGDRSRAELILDAKLTGHTVSGVVLEQQFAVKLGYLLLTTDDCPFEECLHAILLDFNLHQIDQVDLIHPYTPGLFSDMQLISDESITFSFFGKDRWQLSIYDKPRFQILAPFSSVRYQGFILKRHYLNLTERPA